MVKAFSRINGLPVAVGIVPQYLAMSKAFRERFGVDLVIYSGIRTYADQVRIFTERYHVQWIGKGEHNDVRWWRGLRYVRHSGEGTVAQPGTSNHETGRALDLRDTGSDDGVAASFLSARNIWLSKNCWRWGFTHTGKDFKEPWHFEQLQVADPWGGAGKPLSIADNDPGEPLPGSNAGGGGSTTPNPIRKNDAYTHLEEDMVLGLYQPTSGRYKGKHYAIAKGYIKQILSKESVKAYIDAHKEIVTLKELMVTGDEFNVILGVNGISKANGVPILDANGYVLDERASEKYVRGGSWDRGDNTEKSSYRAAKGK